jgi:hypothetical protein
MKVQIKATTKKKTKKITMEIEVNDLKDLHAITFQMVNNMINGVESFQHEWKMNKYRYLMEYKNPTDYIEKKIDGKYYRIFKSNL